MSHRRRNRDRRITFADLLADVPVPERLEVDVEAERERSCGQKMRLPSVSARAMANRLSQERGERLEAYRCCFCGSYHVGHTMSVYRLRQLAAALRAAADDRVVR